MDYTLDLPEGQMGNSEVGHMNLGAGRIVFQDLAKINMSIKRNDSFKNEQGLSSIPSNSHKSPITKKYIFLGLQNRWTEVSTPTLDHLKALIDVAK